ncbi:hypothetical protein F9L33_09535 [Amylibacter sp. SFDW26]|uniref:hypothetical protein n=1 Tax=Amylibacter sp. SFDW26 TaxID=2652722 RepID=UPI00126267D9|nr:hypothetical protein [Amylibacter sp. SFDW26]KAB7613612.1 hypothetical protein F9L33_09535 [Amylibacter sp. SFDW26]
MKIMQLQYNNISNSGNEAHQADSAIETVPAVVNQFNVNQQNSLNDEQVNSLANSIPPPLDTFMKVHVLNSDLRIASDSLSSIFHEARGGFGKIGAGYDIKKLTEIFSGNARK